ncbi:MAG: hypothetical protein QM731_03285 [Chitinophagaceae bacterium]
MRKLLFIFLAIAAVACKHKQQPATDSSAVLLDTVTRPSYSEKDRVRDSSNRRHAIDSFYAIKPRAVFRGDEKTDGFYSMVAALIDTVNVTKTPLSFSDTTIYTYNKKQQPVSRRDVYKSNRFVIELLDPDVEGGTAKQLFINGRKLRAGIEVDTSVSGASYTKMLGINADDCRLMKIGNKEYLFIAGEIDNCNGMGCGVRYYILYDPRIHKAMLLQQFRADFVVGYDGQYKTPVFFDLASQDELNGYFQCFLSSGTLHRFDAAGKIKPVTDPMGKQYSFNAYSKDGVDSFMLVSANLPVSK